MDKRNNILSWILALSLLVILVSAALPILKIDWEGSRYTFAVGALASLVARLMIKHKPTQSLRIKRLRRIENVSSILYCLSAFFIFYPGAGSTDWLGFLTAGAALQIYATFTIDYLEKRDKKRQ